MESYQRDLNTLCESIRQDVALLKSLKVDQSAYDEQYKVMHEDVETSKFACDDNFRNLLGTDNYIEKYLPFTIQTMISDTLR